MTKPRPDAQTLARQIEAYLEAHPKAADTLEGISRWWLRDQGSDIHPEEVLAALKLLQARGVIDVYTAPGGNRIYAQSRQKRH